MMKKYTLQFYESDNKGLSMESKNDGFTPIELLGLIEFKKRDIERQMFGEIKPDRIKREVVVDEASLGGTTP